MSARPGFEPYKVKMVEPVHHTSRAHREARVREVGYNLFGLASRDVTIDLLTDSGTTAMSDRQWAAMLLGDESYAGSASFERLSAAVEAVFGFPYVIPTHQGRGAENVLFSVLVRPGDLVPGNMHFDTTAAHVGLKGGRGVNMPIPEARDPEAQHPFKGNVDLAALEDLLAAERDRVPLVLVTVTCNSGGGQPVSLANLQAVREIADRHGVPVFLDAARCAENAHFIKTREPRWRSASIRRIVGEMAGCADGCLMSGKKDALVNIGGFIAVRDRDLYERLVPVAVSYEGFPTYGGLAGRDLEAMARGLQEVLDDRYLADRIGQVAWFGEQLAARGVPIVRPVGGHAVYVDMKRLLPHIPPDQFPGQAYCVELYVEGGVRAVEVGSLLAGRDPTTGENIRPDLELVRLAVPRQVYSDRHLAYAADCAARVQVRRARLRGMRLVYEPAVLRHFTARFAWVD